MEWVLQKRRKKKDFEVIFLYFFGLLANISAAITAIMAMIARTAIPAYSRFAVSPLTDPGGRVSAGGAVITGVAVTTGVAVAAGVAVGTGVGKAAVKPNTGVYWNV